MPLFKKKKNDDPDLEALLDESAAPPSETHAEVPDSFRSSEEEDLLDQYLNSDTQPLDTPEPPPAAPTDEGDPVSSAPALDQSDEDDDTEDEEAVDLADDVMSIFDDEDEEDEEMMALSKNLEDISAEDILTEARTISRKLARMAEGRVSS